MIRIPKQKYIEAIFSEMRADLMYKFLLLWQTPYFKDLSPYSLIMFASICEVKEFKYGEIVIAQGEIPKECYLIVHGCCESIYQYV